MDGLTVDRNTNVCSDRCNGPRGGRPGNIGRLRSRKTALRPGLLLREPRVQAAAQPEAVGGDRARRPPELQAVLRAKPHQANLSQVVVTLPHSELLEQAHIRTVCTRVQFDADSCPAGSVYGTAVARTPLLSKPLRGPVYLCSGNHKLPDLVAALHGQIDITFSGRIDSAGGRMRTTFDVVPDAPLSSFALTMKGGRRSLLANSRDICGRPGRAGVAMKAHNGRVRDTRAPLAVAGCG